MMMACGACTPARTNGTPSSAAVERRTVEDVYLLTGDLQAIRSTQVTAPHLPQPPQIRWLAEDGSSVKEGEPVAEFDSASVLAGLEEVRTRLVQAEIQLESKGRELEAELDKRRAVLDKAEVEVKKARVDAAVPKELRSSLEWRKMQTTLLERETAHGKARLDLQAFEVQARSDLVGLRSELTKAQRQLATAEANLHSASVTATRSGIFLVGKHWRRDEDRKFQAGDTVWSGFPVASIPDPAAMEVEGRLSEVDHGRIVPGMKARIVLDTFPDRVFTGEVTEVASVADESRERPGFAVRVSLEKPDPALMRPGLSVRVEVVRGRYENALVVPRSAVRFVEGGRVVARASGNDETVPIQACTPLVCVVGSGLRDGDRVRLF